MAQSSVWILAHTLRVSDHQDWRVRTAEGLPPAMLPSEELLAILLSMYQGNMTPMEAGTAAAPADDPETGQPVVLRDGELVHCIHCHKQCKTVLDTWWHDECNTWQRERVLLAVTSVDGPLWLYAVGRADLCEWLLASRLPDDAMEVDAPPAKATRPRDEEEENSGPHKVPRLANASPQQERLRAGLRLLAEMVDFTSLDLANYQPDPPRRRRLTPSEMAAVCRRVQYFPHVEPVLSLIEHCGTTVMSDTAVPVFVPGGGRGLDALAHQRPLSAEDDAALLDLVHPVIDFPEDLPVPPPSLQGAGPVDLGDISGL